MRVRDTYVVCILFVFQFSHVLEWSLFCALASLRPGLDVRFILYEWLSSVVTSMLNPHIRNSHTLHTIYFCDIALQCTYIHTWRLYSLSIGLQMSLRSIKSDSRCWAELSTYTCFHSYCCKEQWTTCAYTRVCCSRTSSLILYEEENWRFLQLLQIHQLI